jgi:hypothetical protein
MPFRKRSNFLVFQRLKMWGGPMPIVVHSQRRMENQPGVFAPSREKILHLSIDTTPGWYVDLQGGSPHLHFLSPVLQSFSVEM